MRVYYRVCVLVSNPLRLTSACRQINPGAVDAAALGHSRHERENEKRLLCFWLRLYGWYNFGKVTEIIATRCHILKPKCMKFDFGWGSTPDPLAGFKRVYF